ncbi:hypothetical protein ACM55F_05290 [Flavobacterium sp. XS2P12]|uniref:hypothetical protein n=1 Tax=Flavobacterium melibiosi TaxID=3398734 RepID=UPI003A8C36B8
MENSENKVYLASNSYCKVGKITSKRYSEEDQSITANDLEKENFIQYDEVLSNAIM